MELPVAPISDSKEHMIYRAVCDERISIPLKDLAHIPQIYTELAGKFWMDSVVEVKGGLALQH